VTIGADTLTADYLVISLGAELSPEAIPGLATAGHNFYALEAHSRCGRPCNVSVRVASSC
jgi:hypothetical protein